LAVPRVRSLAFSILANLLDRQPVNPSSHNRSRCRPSSSIAFPHRQTDDEDGDEESDDEKEYDDEDDSCPFGFGA
jgi:hypothetical protein